MSIRVKHSPDLNIVGQAAGAAGQGEFNQRQQEIIRQQQRHDDSLRLNYAQLYQQAYQQQQNNAFRELQLNYQIEQDQRQSELAQRQFDSKMQLEYDQINAHRQETQLRQQWELERDREKVRYKLSAEDEQVQKELQNIDNKIDKTYGYLSEEQRDELKQKVRATNKRYSAQAVPVPADLEAKRWMAENVVPYTDPQTGETWNMQWIETREGRRLMPIENPNEKSRAKQQETEYKQQIAVEQHHQKQMITAEQDARDSEKAYQEKLRAHENHQADLMYKYEEKKFEYEDRQQKALANWEEKSAEAKAKGKTYDVPKPEIKPYPLQPPVSQPPQLTYKTQVGQRFGEINRMSPAEVYSAVQQIPQGNQSQVAAAPQAEQQPEQQPYVPMTEGQPRGPVPPPPQPDVQAQNGQGFGQQQQTAPPQFEQQLPSFAKPGYEAEVQRNSALRTPRFANDYANAIQYDTSRGSDKPGQQFLDKISEAEATMKRIFKKYKGVIDYSRMDKKDAEEYEAAKRFMRPLTTK